MAKYYYEWDNIAACKRCNRYQFIAYMKTYLTPTIIAKLEGVTAITVARWVREGKFPGTRKVGKQYRVPLESYHAWRESTKVVPIVNVRTFERSIEQ